MDTLYRGISEDMHEDRTGLIPKGTSLLRVALHDGEATFDGSLTYGQSQQNSLFYHQIDSGKYPSSGISTSPDFEVARKYATHNNDVGLVYTIDRKLLKKYGIETFVVSEIIPAPKLPEDKEVILRQRQGKPLPIDIVVKITRVTKLD